MMLRLANVRQEGYLYMHSDLVHPSWNATDEYV